jgi:hypothetical protein
MPKPQTLQQGNKSVRDQFEYSFASVENDHLAYFASFNKSFAVAGITALDRRIFLEKHADQFAVITPGHFRRQKAANSIF